MFLEQINRRLAKVQNMEATPVKVRKPSTPREDGAKVVGVRVAPELYAKLVAIKESHRLQSIKEALLLAAQVGIGVVEERGAGSRAGD